MAEGVLHFDATVVPQRRVPRAHRRRRRPQDVEVPRQHVRPVGGARPPGRGRPALVHAHERLAVGVAPDRPRDARRRGAPVPAAAVERLRVLRHLRERRRVRSRPPGARRRTTDRCSTAGCCPGSRGTVRTARDGLEDYDATAAGRADPGVRRRPLELVRPPLATPVLEPGGEAPPTRPPRSRRCTSAWSPRRPARAVHALRRRRAVAQPRGRPRGRARLGAPRGLPGARRGTMRPGARRRDGGGARRSSSSAGGSGSRRRPGPPTARRGGGPRPGDPTRLDGALESSPTSSTSARSRSRNRRTVRPVAREAELQGARRRLGPRGQSRSPRRSRRRRDRSRAAWPRENTSRHHRRRPR